MKLRFFITDITYRIVDDRAFVYLFGRAQDGRQVCVVDRGFEPYIYARIEEDDKEFDDVFSAISIEDNGLHKVTRVERVRLKWMGRPQLFLKVFFSTPKAVPKLRDLVREVPGVLGIHEYDILFVRRYLIDKGLVPMTLVEAECSPAVGEMRVETFELTSIKPVGDETFTDPRMVAVDIEVYNPDGRQVSPDRHPIVMLSLHGDGINKVLTWKRFRTDDKTVEFVDGEAELLQRFSELIKALSPDFILGYYSDGFDFPFIRKRARYHKVKLDLGMDHSELNVRGRNVVVSEITGIPHIDVCRFVQRIIGRVMETDVYTLDAVAEELMGVNKIEVDIERLAAEWDAGSEMLGGFCKYCLHDAKITYDLAKYLFPNMLELVKVVGLPVFDTTRSSMSQFVEWYIIRQASVVGEVCPNKPGYQTERARAHERAKGALVYTPKPGLYDNVVVFDYRSLYPSIMASHNISPDTYRCRCCESEGRVPLEEADHWFCTKKKGFISSIIEDVIQRRARIKELLRKKKDVLLEARSQALKVLANSFYGYTGFAPARWYCFECQESITAWGRHHIKDVIDKAESEGFKVRYSDTDSLFVELRKKTKEDAMKFVERINANLPGLMELEYENMYKTGLFVPLKASEAGAKKKYALLSESGDLKIIGFATVRRNVSPIAKRVQREVLEIVLKEKDVDKAKNYVSGIVKRLKGHEVKVEDVTLFTKLQKDIEKYAAVGPHVAAAKRMREKGMPVARGTPLYYVIVKGKGRIRDKVRLPDEITQDDYDPEYYIHNQILPAVDRIFAVFNISEEDIEGTPQKTLGAF